MYINGIHIRNKDVCNIHVVFNLWNSSWLIDIPCWNLVANKIEAGFSVANVLFAVWESQQFHFGPSKSSFVFFVFSKESCGFFCLHMYDILSVYWNDICVYAVYWKKEPNILKQINSWRKHFRSTSYQDPTFSHFGDPRGRLCLRKETPKKFLSLTCIPQWV